MSSEHHVVASSCCSRLPLGLASCATHTNSVALGLLNKRGSPAIRSRYYRHMDGGFTMHLPQFTYYDLLQRLSCIHLKKVYRCHVKVCSWVRLGRGGGGGQSLIKGREFRRIVDMETKEFEEE